MTVKAGQRLREFTAHLTQSGNRGGSPGSRRRGSLVAAFAVTVAVALGGAVLPAHGAGTPVAVLPVIPSSTQFDITGLIESATVDAAADAHSGGVLTVNGSTVVIPRETIVILPANALTWQELFSHAPGGYAPTQTGMALADSPKPMTTYEVNVIGNRVVDPNGINGCKVAAGCDRLIAGLVHISQNDLNANTGYINFIDYGTGEFEVGGKLGVQGTGARVRLNDPAMSTSGSGGRYGRATSPDDRFQVDQDNPTVLAETGFPMCIPRTDPQGATPDPLCPETNRPIVSTPATDKSGITPNPNALVAGTYYHIFRMDDPANIDTNAALCLRAPCADPRKQAPLEIGDYVNVAGTLVSNATGPYISAHTVNASLGIYTQPGKNPAYVSLDVSLIGTGGLTVFGAGEAAARTRFEGMATDETRAIRVYGVDVNASTGATTDREWGSIMPDLGPPTGAVRGRWRFRPPCTVSVPTTKSCVGPAAGQFIPPTREVRAVVDGFSQFKPGGSTANANSQVPGTPGANTAANGLYWGQYHAPIGEYIFPENIPGSAIPEDNFNTIPFLANGGYQSITGVQAGVLSPWPSNVLPNAGVCATATIVGGPYSVVTGGSLQLSGTVTAGASAPVSVNWTAGTTANGTNLNAALTGATTTTPTFSAIGLAAGTYNLAFTATNPCGASVANTTITVSGAPGPAINPITNPTVTAGTPVTLTATSASLPAPTWTWLQTGGPANPVLTQTPAAASASATSSLSFNPTVAGTYTFTVKAANSQGTSPASTVTVTATANTPTTVTLTNTEYRTTKQRLVISATTTDPLVTSMVLQPYQTETGTTFDPATLGGNLTVSLVAPGTFTMTLVGAPPPACNLGGTYATPCSKTPLTVKAVNAAGAIVGTSPATVMQKIRA
ncbi:MAG: hypothetical protein WCP95_12995 [Actinomycetes bacterium]